MMTGFPQRCLLRLVLPLLLMGTLLQAGSVLRISEKDAKKEFEKRLRAAKGSIPALDAALDAEILRSASLLEEGFAMRRKLTEIANVIQSREGKGKPLNGRDLDQLNQAIRAGIDVCGRIFETVDIHVGWRTCDAEQAAAAGLPELPMELRVKGTMFSLAGSLFLYDTYRLHVASLVGNDKVRNLLDHGDPGYEIHRNLLRDVTEQFLSFGNRLEARHQLAFCDAGRKQAGARYGTTVSFRVLCQLIDQSPSRSYFATDPLLLPFAASAEHTQVRLAMARKDLANLAEESVGKLSQFFGNTVGLVETRKGKLYGKPRVERHLRSILKPGDILLEKTPFRLTDTFIPGHFGHVAIWGGTEKQLRELGLWDDPVVKPHQDAFRNGREVVEALRSGVGINPLSHFLNIDDVAILRKRDLSKEAQAHLIRMAMRQVGKEYDFNFDVETTSKIVCSELVYVVYTDVKWPTEKALGRYTISPDNVAMKALPGGPFELVCFYNDGKQVKRKALERMVKLMGAATENSSSAQ